MNAVMIDGRRKSAMLDAIAWAVALGVLVLIPILVGALRTPPALGPVKDPSILYIFLTLMSLIGLSTVAVYAMMITKRIDKDLGVNILNFHAKFIGALFIISGFVKLQDPVGFSYKLDDYWDFFQSNISRDPEGFASFMKPLSIYIAAAVSVFEVTLALALMFGYRMRITGWILLLLILFFTLLTGLATFTDELTDCGCFGDALKLKPVESFLKDILLTVAVVPVFLLRGRMMPFYKRPFPSAVTLVGFVVPAAISFYCYQYYPLIDFRGAYTVGQNLKYNSENVDEEEGQIIAHDFGDFAMECGHDGFVGPTLYIVMYNPQYSSEKALKEAAQLVADLKAKAPGIYVAAGINMGAKQRQKLNLPFAEDFCFSLQDEKVLKTMVRSSPGYMLLKDGVVLKKWHYNSIPSVEELKKLAGPDADKVPAPVVTPADTLVPTPSTDSIQ